MKNYVHLVSFSLLVASCVSCIESRFLNSNTNYFDANKHVKVTVITDILVNADTLKSLLVVPYGDYYFEMGKNLGYFNEVMTYYQFEDKILELGDTLDLRYLEPDKVKLHKAAKLYKPFVIMNEPTLQLDENDAFIAVLKVYDPLKGETIFENKVFTKNAILLNNKKILFPLYNSLLEYLRKQR